MGYSAVEPYIGERNYGNKLRGAPQEVSDGGRDSTSLPQGTFAKNERIEL